MSCPHLTSCPVARAHPCLVHANAAVPELEVMDTTEIKSLQGLLEVERERVAAERVAAKAEQRKVQRVNCDLDLKRISKIMTWTEHVLKDGNRTW